jgi:hypothetical protein
MIKKDWWTRNYQNRLMIIGIMLTIFGIYELQDSFAIKSRLKGLKGTIRSADTYTETVTDRYGHSSQKCELIFYLNGYEKKFYLAHNIGDEYYDKEYENILQQINQADSITVWIRLQDIEDFQPKIFQITNGNEIILNFNDVRTEKSPVTLFMLIFGIGSIALFIYFRYPDKWKKIMN